RKTSSFPVGQREIPAPRARIAGTGRAKAQPAAREERAAGGRSAGKKSPPQLIGASSCAARKRKGKRGIRNRHRRRLPRRIAGTLAANVPYWNNRGSRKPLLSWHGRCSAASRSIA